MPVCYGQLSTSIPFIDVSFGLEFIHVCSVVTKKEVLHINDGSRCFSIFAAEKEFVVFCIYLPSAPRAKPCYTRVIL